MANISLSHVEAKAMKFLEDVVKKSSKKPVLKAARKCEKTPLLMVTKFFGQLLGIN